MSLRGRVFAAYARRRGWAERWLRLHLRLPWSQAKLAWRLYVEAHRRWWTGLSTPTGDVVALPIPGSQHGTVYIRPGTTDPLVYYDVLVNELYGRFIPEGPISRVLDLGANIGLASVFFLSRFPGCRVVAVEPDPQNAAVCRRNLEPFSDRAVLVQGAVWSEDARLSLLSQHAGTWASSVDVDPEGQIEGHTIAALIGMLGGTADIVKIDIEGAEQAILDAPDTSWIDDVRCVAMEPEHISSLEAFQRAAAGRMRIVHRYGDVVFASRVT